MTHLAGGLREAPRGRPPGRRSTIGAPDWPSAPAPMPAGLGSCFTQTWLAPGEGRRPPPSWSIWGPNSMSCNRDRRRRVGAAVDSPGKPP